MPQLQRFHYAAGLVAVAAVAATLAAAIGSLDWAVALFALALAGVVGTLVLSDRRTQTAVTRRAAAIRRRVAAPAAPASVAPAPQTPVAAGAPPAVPDEQADIELVLRSGLFDPAWYVWQLGGEQHPERELVRHYLSEGHRIGMTATPALLESWYRKTHQKDAAQAPLIHYLRHRKQAVALHPLFPTELYVARFPKSVTHPGGPLAHYLAKDAPARGRLLDRSDFLERANRTAEMLFATRGTEHLQRQSPTFDFAAEERYKADLRADSSLLATHPKVSVIMPTMNRAVPLRAAITSVLGQTYDNWELIIVDDGGTDDTPSVVAEYTSDPRVQFLRYEINKGVATARNTGIRSATGEYIAYLDSDNEWHPDFLEIMLRHIERQGMEAAYSATALVESGGQQRRLYRGMPFDRDALRERNFIDCIALVHRRSLLDRTGAFDESLRRTVDWDLLIRLADVTTPSFAPFIGSTYDVWEERSGRITTDVPEGYRFRVRQRTLVNWDDVRRRAQDAADGLSIVVTVTQPAEVALPILRRLLTATTGDHELVVVDDHIADNEAALLFNALQNESSVRYHRLSQALPLEVANNVGASLASRSTLAFVHESLWASVGWDEPLLEVLPDVAAVQPLLLTEAGTVWSAGASFATGRHSRLFTDMAGDSPEVRGTRETDAVTNACVVARAVDFAKVRGFDPLFLRHTAGADLAVRLRSATGLSAACVGYSVLSFRGDPQQPGAGGPLLRALRNENELVRTWEHAGLVPLDPYAEVDIRPAAHRHTGSREPQVTPLYVHSRAERPLRWSIKIGPPTVHVRETWGDYHFANALRDELEALGHMVTVDCRGAWYRPTAHLDDVVVSLQGRGRYLPSTGQINVLWMMSHPEETSFDELTNFDVVFGASRRWLDRARMYTRQEPEMLLQCTDPRRFHLGDVDPARRHEILMVGNARGDGPRAAVKAALDAGLVPSVYGQRWKGFVPAGTIKGTYLPNEQLSSYYASAGAVLNDHWEDMKDWGIISNRLFDLAACGARVVSDEVEGLDEVFGGLIATYGDSDELRAQVERLQSEGPEDARRRVQLAEHVRTAHSFAARAATISDRVLGVLRETGSDPRLIGSAADRG